MHTRISTFATFALSAALFAALPVQAQAPAVQGQGGFQGPVAQTRVNTVAEARKAWDDTPVTLTGYIVQRMPHDDDDYLFRDDTGEIVVDIDHEIFRGTPSPRKPGCASRVK